MLSTLKFVLFTAMSIAMIFTAVYLTVLNTYKPAVKTYINGEFVGYFTDEQNIDEVYNDLVAEKQSIDENVKVYLESEPTFEQSYIKDSVLEEQNVYTNLRAEIKTEYTIYDLVVDGEEMKFTAEEQAEDYIEKLKAEIDNVDAKITVEKVSELEGITSTDRADDILASVIDRNKPVEPVYEEQILGTAEVRKIFKFSKIGNIAGCHVTDGLIKNGAEARLIRDGVVVYTSKIASLQHEKDQVKEAKNGFDCGITIADYQDIREGDLIECFQMVEVKR